MKTKDQAIEIRQIYVETGGNISETARRTGVSRDTVRRVLIRDYSTNQGKKHRTRVHPFDAEIEQILSENLDFESASHKLKLTSMRIANILHAHGCRLSYQQINRRVKAVRAKLRTRENKEAFLLLEPSKGAFQVDFGTFATFIHGELAKIHVLIVSSAYSNAAFFHACRSEDTANLFEGLEACFEQIGGVPSFLRFDNATPIAFFEKRTRQLTEPFTRFMIHHGFKAELCNPRSGWEKGNVENKVKYLRNNFFNPVAQTNFNSIEELNTELQRFSVQDQNRVHYKRGALISLLFESEKPLFLPLKSSFEYEEIRQCSVNNQGFIRFRGNFYFVRHDMVYKTVEVHANAQTVAIFNEFFEKIAEYERCYKIGVHIQTANELAEMLATKRRAITSVIHPRKNAEVLLEQLTTCSHGEAVKRIMQVLTETKNASTINERDALQVVEGARVSNLNKYDTMARIDGQTKDNHSTLQQIKAWFGHSGNDSGT